LDGGKVSCFTCGHRCTISDGRRGVCGVMENRGGVLFSLVYGKAAAMHVDPIEKKPFFHFRPGSSAFSVATVGCNMRCLNCQNADISQMPSDQGRIEGMETTPEAVVAAAMESGAHIISYTYTEPAVYLDLRSTSRRSRSKRESRTLSSRTGISPKRRSAQPRPWCGRRTLT
jgi:pyruvate formate lyase activating enzyme